MSDLISREAAIAAIINEKFIIMPQLDPLYDGLGFMGKRADYNASCDIVIGILEKLPSAQRWIQVSEMVPDDLAEVNVTWVNHNPEPYYDFIKDKPCTGTAVFYKKQWFWSSPTCVDYLAEYGRNDMCKVDNDIEITAWMPLPEPYKGGCLHE